MTLFGCSSLGITQGGHFELKDGVETYVNGGQVVIDTLVTDGGKMYYTDSQGHKVKDAWKIIDNDGNYCPENCRWATRVTQCNNRRSNINITIDGETKTLQEWCNEYNQPYRRIHRRITNGWNPVEAVTFKEDARLVNRKQKGKK